ncbi:MAG: VTT domain-containing protein [Fibrobacterota bacterium]|nr:MAG: VTT domain-containing protein [Fibrobacterota bacterium]
MGVWLDQLIASLAGLPWFLQFLGISTAAGFTEEIAVVAVVAMARSGHLGWWMALFALWWGTLIGNMLMWWLGRLAGERALRWKWIAGIGHHRLEMIRHQVRTKGWLAVFAARLIPGTRVGVFLLAGILGMNGWVFGLTLAVGTAVWMASLLGLVQVVGKLGQAHPWVAAGVVLLLLAVGVALMRRRLRSLDAAT